MNGLSRLSFPIFRIGSRHRFYATAKPRRKTPTDAEVAPVGPMEISQFGLFSCVCIGMVFGVKGADVLFQPDLTLPLEAAAKALEEQAAAETQSK
ncbi:hypothetical protein BCR33DRAFT_789825 [Rhizoclosmatium globosum]|uniref:Uncharacterized protein n=1 Tax=Rhizoclosmatium globosum TaxID=329046 RepID=A0A1Y2BR87_9FUNG|nr:hypothetical protein BCR33DRAFT_789825 [Rhizoclosmatium globosum]|eukprot:ORY37252.1 hypothetical protein BCR33DRAFT_789825 [Rhizoclosmatium globosum]